MNSIALPSLIRVRRSILRQLADLPNRIAEGLSPERIGGTLSQAGADLYMMERARKPQVVAA